MQRQIVNVFRFLYQCNFRKMAKIADRGRILTETGTNFDLRTKVHIRKVCSISVIVFSIGIEPITTKSPTRPTSPLRGSIIKLINTCMTVFYRKQPLNNETNKWIGSGLQL